MPAKANATSSWVWRISSAVVTLIGWYCLVWLLSAPSEISAAFLFGYSLPRILLALLILAPSAALTIFTARLWLNARSNWMAKFLKQLTKSDLSFWILLVLVIAPLFVFWILYFLPEKRTILLLESISLYLSVAKPFLLFGIAFSIFTFAQLLIARYGLVVPETRLTTFRFALTLFLSLLALVAVISISGIGLGFDASVWNAPGTPVLISQVLLVLLCATLIVIALHWLNKHTRKWARPNFYIDIGMATLVWLFASVLWLSQPAPSTYYDTPPLPPSYQSYPLSDAFNHDVIANNVLIGEGFRFGGQVAVRRPVYVMLLAGLEALLGANYDAVVIGQVLVLALFPALLYLLGAKFHSKFAGLLLAGIIAFREANSIVLGDVINSSHAKLLMADLPTALLVAGLALAVFSWMRRDPSNLVAHLLAGGLLGRSILLRSQSLTLLPFLVLMVLLVWGWRAGWRAILIFILGVSLVISPWIVRNRVLMGQWAIEDAVVSGFLANRYSFTPGTFGLPFQRGESEGEYYARQMASVRDFAFHNPGYVASFVADNFIRNQMLNFLALPLSLELRDLESHVRELPFWPGWQGDLPSESYLPILANLALVSVGIAAAWKRFRWVGIMPLFINFGFTLNLALARVSGWRYNLPVDWTILLFYAIGIAECIYWVLLSLRSGVSKVWITEGYGQSGDRQAKRSKRSAVAGPIFLTALSLSLIGSSFLIIENVSAPRYFHMSDQQAASLLETAELPGEEYESERQQLLELLDTGKLTVLNGRALHPRYYRSGEGEPDRGFVLIDPMDFNRITFYLIGPDPTSVIIRTDNPAINFPASSDVVVLRCGSTLEAAGLVVKSDSNQNLYFSSDLLLSCPAIEN